MKRHVGATVVAAAVVLLAGCAGEGGTDAPPSVSTSTKTATETVTSKPKMTTTTQTATQTVTETVSAAAPAPSTPAAPQAPFPTSTTPAGNTTVGPDGVTYQVPTTDEGFEGWCSRLEIPEEVRAPHCLAE